MASSVRDLSHTPPAPFPCAGVPQADSLHYEQQHRFKFFLTAAHSSVTSVSIVAVRRAVRSCGGQ